MIRPALLLALVLAACEAPEPQAVTLDTTAPPTAPLSPLFQSGLWPGEGIPVLEAGATPIILRAAPDPAAPVRDSLAVAVGTRLAFDSTRVITWRGGELVATRTFTLSGRNLGPARSLSRDAYYEGTAPAVEVPVDSGTVVTLLQYRAEGACFVLVGEDVIEAETCPMLLDPPATTQATEPAVYWWVWIVDGARAGWAEVDDKALKVVDREF
jgi:hypothetical protein